MPKNNQPGPELARPRTPDANAEPTASFVLSPLASLRKHPLIAVAVFLTALGAGAPLALKLGKPDYYASAVIYVSPTFIRTLREDHEQERQYSSYVEQQILTIPRYDILAETLAKLEEQGIYWRRSRETEQSATARLKKALEITHVPESYQITIGLREKDPENLAAVVNCLAETFIRKARSEEFYGEGSRVATLSLERGKLQADLDRKEQERAGLAQGLSVVNFDQQSETPQNKLWMQAQASLDAARMKRIEAESRLEILTRDGEAAKPPADDSGPPDPADTARIAALGQRRLELVEAMEGLKPQHPDYRAAQQQISHIDQLLKAPLTVRANEKPSAQAIAQAQALASAKLEAESARRVEAELSSRTEAGAAKVAQMSDGFQRARDLGSQIDQIRTQINAIDDRLSYFRLEGNSPGFLRISSAAQRPQMPEKNNRNKYLAMLLGGALASGLCFVMLIDLARRRILIAADVEEALGFPALGIVLVRNARTRHFAEEHFVRLVNKMERIYRQSGARILVFTPIKPEGGPNATVARLGQSLQSRGIRTTVVDANTFGLERLDRESPADADAAGTLAMRTIGAPANPVARKRPELLSAGIQPPSHSTSRFSAALAQLLEDYEVILVEAPPLLLSADAEYLATISGATFLTVEAGHVTKGELKRAASLMEKLQPPGIGVILHRVSLKSPDFELRRRFREYEACRARTKTA